LTTVSVRKLSDESEVVRLRRELANVQPELAVLKKFDACSTRLKSVRNFAGINLTHESAPDETTLLKFRRLFEANNLTRRVFNEINEHLANKGLTMREGTIVDATLIAAPPSTATVTRNAIRRCISR